MYSRSVLYDYAMQLVGLPYRWGGDDPMSGFDCSGLCMELLASAGVVPHKLDLTAQGIYTRLTREGCLSNEKAKYGALIFFGTDATKITHVGFCLNATLMLEAGGGGSKTKHINDAIKENAYVRIRPQDTRKDRVSVVMPKYSWDKSDG